VKKRRRRRKEAYIRRCGWCLCWFGTPYLDDCFCCPAHKRLFKDFEKGKIRDL